MITTGCAKTDIDVRKQMLEIRVKKRSRMRCTYAFLHLCILTLMHFCIFAFCISALLQFCIFASFTLNDYDKQTYGQSITQKDQLTILSQANICETLLGFSVEQQSKKTKVSNQKTGRCKQKRRLMSIRWNVITIVIQDHYRTRNIYKMTKIQKEE